MSSSKKLRKTSNMMAFTSSEDLMKNLPKAMANMSKAMGGGGFPSDSPTFKISMREYKDMAKEYDDWLRRYLAIERNVPGYLGTTIIMPGGANSAIRYIIQRYMDKASMRAWKNSQESLKLIEEANNYSILHYATGMETWFTLPDLNPIVPPPKWKMAIVVFMAAYSISSLSRYILNPYLGLQPLLFNLSMTIILVIGLTYFAMPLLSRLLRRWLYPKSL